MQKVSASMTVDDSATQSVGSEVHVLILVASRCNGSEQAEESSRVMAMTQCSFGVQIARYAHFRLRKEESDRCTCQQLRDAMPHQGAESCGSDLKAHMASKRHLLLKSNAMT